MFKKENGLTIIELLATIAILVATVTAVLALGNRAVAQVGVFTANTQATFLAKEAMEILEDSTIRSTIINDEGEELSFWKIDYAKIEGPESEQDCRRKVKINSSGYYEIGGNSDSETSFSRCVIAQKNGDELAIEVEVAFDYRNNNYKVSLYRIFYD